MLLEKPHFFCPYSQVDLALHVIVTLALKLKRLVDLLQARLDLILRVENSFESSFCIRNIKKPPNHLVIAFDFKLFELDGGHLVLEVP